MVVVLYGNGCPKCLIMEKLLQRKEIPYTKEDDLNALASIGIKSVPVLCVDGEMMDFSAASKWIAGR